MTEERLETLMVKVVDGVATAAERDELMRHVVSRPELARELDRHRAVKAVTDGWVARLELDLAEDRQRRSAPMRGAAALGVTLLLGGFGVLAGGGVVEAIVAPDAPMWVRLGIGLTVAGSLVLLGWAAVWRVRTRGQDRYSAVTR